MGNVYSYYTPVLALWTQAEPAYQYVRRTVFSTWVFSTWADPLPAPLAPPPRCPLQVQQYYLPHKTVGQIVSYYYNVWKIHLTAASVEYHRQRNAERALRDEVSDEEDQRRRAAV